MNLKKEIFQRETGQSLVEFALILPVLLVLILGIIEFGWRFMSEITVTNAVREGARYAAVHEGTSDTTLETLANNSLLDHLTPANFDSPSINGDSVRVVIRVTYQPLTGFFPFLNTVTITKSAEMRIEYN